MGSADSDSAALGVGGGFSVAEQGGVHVGCDKAFLLTHDSVSYPSVLEEGETINH